MKKNLARILVLITASVFGWFVFDNPIILDLNIVATIFIPLLILGAVSRMYGVSPACLWEASGISLAVALSSVGLIEILHSLGNPNEIYRLSGAAFTAIFWGGIAAGLGYCMRPKIINYARLPNTCSALLCMILFGFICWEMHNLPSGIGAFLYPFPLVCVSLPPCLYWSVCVLNDKSVDPAKCLQLVLLGGLGGVVFAIVEYLGFGLTQDSDGNFPGSGPAVVVGILSLAYSSLVLLGAAIFFGHGAHQKIDFNRLNWHLLEMFALFNLMIFAPLTLPELSSLLPH
tara:strand:+ start:58 stop:918 length:861 start_codon:yes stop_codon:yes gene_type:complete